MRLFHRKGNSNCIRRDMMVQIAIATLTFLLLVMVWPCNVVQRHSYSRQQAVSRRERAFLTGDRFTASDKKLQTVTFSQDHIYQINLYMNCVIDDEASGAESILFRLYNDEFSCIYEESIDSRHIEKKGVMTALPDMDVDIGALYYYEILVSEESHAVYELPIADRNTLAQTENGVLYIDGIYNSDKSLIADFDYSRPLTIIGVLLCDLLILGFSLLVYFLVYCAMMIYDQRFEGNKENVRKYFCMGISGIAFLAALILIVYSVILNRFGGELWDRIFFLIGIIVALLWVFSALWIPILYPKKKDRTRVSARGQVSLIWRNYIQTVCFGLLFYALCQYVNADRNYYHYTNTRWMLIFLAIALLMNYSEKQFINKYSGIWIFLGAVGSVFYCRKNGIDENTLLLARLSCGVVVSWGVLILNILYDLLRMRAMTFSRQQIIFITLWVLFALLMYVNRYEKVWVFTATLPFIAFLFAPNSFLMECRFLKNFSNGVLLSFMLVTMFCFAHRPHHYWMLYRYGGIFHTVACTGMYLAVVFGTALAKLYGKLKNRKGMFRLCFPEYFAVVCAVGFILLTMSRTAFLTTAVTLLSITALAAVVYRKTARRIAAELVILAAVSLVSFPMVFTAVRMVPAVVNDPVRYDIEFQDRSFMVYEGDPIDSDKYMTVRRFFQTLFGRFQTTEQAHAQEAGNLCWRETGTLVYTGEGLAGLGRLSFSEDHDQAEDADGHDISNGRFEIFGDYIKAIGFGGHPRMGPLDRKGDEYAHAHNSYLQVAYNFGLIAGILFLVLCAATLWRSIRFALDYGNKYSIVFVPFAMVIVFGFISLTEWAYHPCIPAGFSFILMQMVLMRADTQGK